MVKSTTVFLLAEQSKRGRSSKASEVSRWSNGPSWRLSISPVKTYSKNISSRKLEAYFEMLDSESFKETYADIAIDPAVR